MSADTVGPASSQDDLLFRVSQLDTPALEQFIAEVLTIRARRIAPVLGAKETELLKRINRELPPSVRQRLDELTARRRAETLTTEEHQELVSLTDDIELSDAQRIRDLTELAAVRQVSVPTLMRELGVRPPDYA